MNYDIFHMIDPPVSPYSNSEDIKNWLNDLKEIQAKEKIQKIYSNIDSCINEAKELLKWRQELDDR